MTQSRRRFIGTALAGAAIPSLSRAQAGNFADNQEQTDMRVRFTFNDLTMTVCSMIPLRPGTSFRCCRSS